MTTTVLYNGVELRNVQTLRFEQTAEYDESDTDLLLHRFIISVEGTVHLDGRTGHLAILPSYPTVFASATDVMRAIQAQLLHPRGDFAYLLGSDVMLRVKPPLSTVAVGGVVVKGTVPDPLADVKNGPKPRSCQIVHVAGANVFRVQFTIELNVVKCLAGSGASNPQGDGGVNPVENPWVLSNRWSLEEAKDDQFFSQRTWDGVLRVRSGAKWPHIFRWMCAPGLQRGWRRVAQRFVQSADGLWLRYTITDRQMHAAPPAPAVDWRATYSESLGAHGTVGHAHMQITMIGGPGSNKRALFAAAIDVLLARLRGLKSGVAGSLNDPEEEKDHGVILDNAMFSHQEQANEVEVRATISRWASTPETLWNMATEQIGTPLELEDRPEYDPSRWPMPTPYSGDSLSGIFATYFQSPCHPFHGIVGPAYSPGQEPEGEEPEESEPVADTPYSDTYESNELEPPSDAGDARSELQAFSGKPYTYSSIDQKYATSAGRIHLPYASIPGQAIVQVNQIQIPEQQQQQQQQQLLLSGVFQLHAPTAQRIYRVMLERVGAWPEIPRPEDVLDPNGIPEYLLSADISPEAPEVIPDGSGLLYKIQARYVYALSRPPTTLERLRSGSSPADATTAQRNQFPGQSGFVGDGVLG